MKKRFLFVCWCLLAVDCAFSEDIHALLPESVSQITLGLSWKAFLKENPEVALVNLGVDGSPNPKPNPEIPQAGLSQKLSNPEGVIIYLFSQGKLQGFLLNRKTSHGVVEMFLSDSKRMFGNAPKVSEDSSMPRSDIYTWTRNDRLIQTIVPRDEKTGEVSLRVLSFEYAKQLGLSSYINK